ncbi:MAG: hypothetical protein RMJ44_10710 [Cytophagales bacterium]|nr:hypothetical protein [Bernardetiaceae bacterium]MDW8211545.1 hypothetical protein [Cytophagales bacterium]
MIRLCLHVWLTLLVVVYCPPIIAQKKPPKQPTSPPKDQAAECVQLLYDFAKAYSEISIHRDKNKVLAHFSPSLNTEITTVNIRNNVQSRYSDYNQFSQYLDGLINARSLRINYTIEKILHTIVKNNFAIVVYETSYNIFREGESLIQGREINTANMVKNNNRWLITYYTIFDVAASQQRGSCHCEIFKSEEGKYVTRTSYPGGARYEAKMDNFAITVDMRVGGKLIRVRDRYFAWKRNGSIFSLVLEGEKFIETGSELGVTDEETEALLIILHKALFADNCLSVRKK